jgi:tripartite-type tricarboxylate transporter receptor subunit TctC
MKRLSVLRLSAMMLGFTLLRGSGLAQQKSYPEKPITLLVPYGADGASDQVARALADAAKKHLRQPIVVVNRPGESGTRAIVEALGATPDGYTLAWGTEGTLTVQPHRTNLPYRGPDTYVPVAKLTALSNVLVVRAGAPWQTAEQFLNDARAHPGELSVGVPDVATVAHLNAEQQVRKVEEERRQAILRNDNRPWRRPDRLGPPTGRNQCNQNGFFRPHL